MKEPMTSITTEMNKNLENNELQQPQKKVYSVKSVYACTFLGGPFAGAYILASNFKVLGDKQAVLFTWVATVALLCLLLGVPIYDIIHNPESSSDMPSLTVPILYSAAYMGIGLWLQGKKVELLLQHGGKQYSFGMLCLVTVVSLIAMLALMFIVYYSVFGDELFMAFS